MARTKSHESYGAKVISQPWHGHAAHRNFASAHATQPWLLAIDADEVVSEKLRDEIIAAFQNHGSAPPAAYSFPRLSFFCGRWIRHGNWYPDRKVRLWRKDTGQWEGDPHEKLVLRGTVVRLRADLLHFSNENIDHLLGKIGLVSTNFVNANADAAAAHALDRSGDSPGSGNFSAPIFCGSVFSTAGTDITSRGWTHFPPSHVIPK